jgi:hypothetical protein
MVNYQVLINDKLCVVSNAVDDSICDFFVQYAERESTKGKSIWNFRPCKFGDRHDGEVRNSHEIHVKDKLFVGLMWDTVEKHIPKVYMGRKLIGHNGGSHYLLRYKHGEKFETHRDGHDTDSNGNKSLLTALVYMNNCEEGGETRFFNEPTLGITLDNRCQEPHLDLRPRKGSLVLMWHNVLHKAMPVIKGVKYAYRFTIYYERFGDEGWYTGPSRKNLKEGKVYSEHDRPDGTPPRRYLFSPCNLTPIPGRLPGEGEDRCENCYEILELKYDYYNCPGCKMPVIYTQR